MNTQDKLLKLEEARRILKSEFIGINGIIDQLIQSVIPWYVTPEILERPLIISLWGITGTGKTSIIRRLFEILEISRVAVFDSGEIAEASGSFGNMITDALSIDIFDNNLEKFQDTVFVFDEFQHARTIDEKGCEITKPKTRQMWNLIDTGKVTIHDYDYSLNKVTTFLEDLEGFVKEHPDVPIENLVMSDPSCISDLLTEIGLNWYDSRTRELFTKNHFLDSSCCSSRVEKYRDMVDDENEEEDSNDEVNKKDPLRPLCIMTSDILRYYTVVVSRYEPDTSMKDLYQKLLSCKTVDEVCTIIGSLKNFVGGQKTLNFSKSIIFLIGNLDEAFLGSKDIDPDTNADAFKQEIDKVTIADIKDSLLTRFRAEQIARMGNTILKYPAFSELNYRQIIELELNKVLGKFYESTGKRIIYTQDIVDLVYSEGVFPAQGCRPIFTTVSGLFTPLLSSAALEFEETDKLIEACIEEPESGYRKDEKYVVFKSKNSEKTKRHRIQLVLGTSRNPEHNQLRYVIGIHEAGHAVMYAWCFGKMPIEIVSTAASGGGYTSFPDHTSELLSVKRNIQADIMVCLGGIMAEKLFFDGPNSGTPGITTGASRDLETAYKRLAHAAYSCGYFDPKVYKNYEVSTIPAGIPTGFDDQSVSGKYSGRTLGGLMSKEFDTLIEEVKKILAVNRGLIKKTGILTAERGKISGEEFRELIEEFSSSTGSDYTLNENRLEHAEKSASLDSYEKILKMKN